MQAKDKLRSIFLKGHGHDVCEKLFLPFLKLTMFFLSHFAYFTKIWGSVFELYARYIAPNYKFCLHFENIGFFFKTVNIYMQYQIELNMSLYIRHNRFKNK